MSQIRLARTEAGQPRRRNKLPSLLFKKKEEKSEWWIVDGEMHEIGDHVPPRERFTIPRDNIPNKRRKQLREQFMRRTRLVLKESVQSLDFSIVTFIWKNSIVLSCSSIGKNPAFNIILMQFQ